MINVGRQGRYQILSLLGRGAAGEVYETYDCVRREVVALKRLTHIDAESMLRFKREFRALSNVKHENLVELYDLVGDQHGWFLTMEFLSSGLNLRDYLCGSTCPDAARPPSSSASRRMSLDRTKLEQLAVTFAQLAAGLGALHAAGLLHRDIKPDNVLVDDGRVVLVDFGLVTDMPGSNTRAVLAGEVVGTPAYMAPEQCSGEVTTAAADWYAVGVMLFEVLTGRPPFAGSDLDVFENKCLRTAPRARAIRPEVPAALDRLIAGLLSIDPEERPCGREVLDQLGEIAPVANSANSVEVVRAAQVQPFIGREAELAALEQAFEDAKAKQLVITFVAGTSGMGKSALLERFLNEVVSEQALVLAGRCYEHEVVPFKGIDSIIDALAQHLSMLAPEQASELIPPNAWPLARLFPVLSQLPALCGELESASDAADVHLLRQQALSILREVFVRLAHNAPVIVYMDDVQWGDEDSAVAFATLLAPPNPPPLLVLMGCRAEHVHNSVLLERLRAISRPRLVNVGALPSAEAHDVAATWLGCDPHSAAVATIVAAAGGSPFFLGEFARHVQSTGADPSRLSLASILQARVEAIPKEAKDLLEALAVAGGPVELSLAGRVAALDTKASKHALRVLRGAHLVRETARGGTQPNFETFHDKIRESVVSAMSKEDLRARHLAFVNSLMAAGGADAEKLFVHCRGAGLLSLAIEHARAAAVHAERTLAFDTAERMYAAARELLPADAWTAHYRQTFELHIEEGKSAFLAGHVLAANAAFDVARHNAKDHLDLASIERLRASLELGAGRTSEAIDSGLRALGLLGVRLRRGASKAAVAWALLRSSMQVRAYDTQRLAAVPLASDPAQALTLQTLADLAVPSFFIDQNLMVLADTKALEFSLTRGRARNTPQIYASMAVLLHSTMGRHQAARALTEAAALMLEQQPDPYIEGKVYFTVGALLTPWWQPLSTACAELRRAIRTTTVAGDIVYMTYSVISLVIDCVIMGTPLNEVAAVLDEHSTSILRTNYIDSREAFQLLTQAIRCLRGHTACATTLDDSAYDETARFSLFKNFATKTTLHTYYLLKSLTHYVAADFTQGCKFSALSAPEVEQACFALPQTVEHHFVYALNLLGKAQGSERALTRPERRHLRVAIKRLRQAAAAAPHNFAHKRDLVEAALYACKGRKHDADTLFRHAREGAHAVSAVRDEAFALELMAAHHRRCGDEATAHEALRAARNAFARWGASRKVAAMDEALAHAGTSKRDLLSA